MGFWSKLGKIASIAAPIAAIPFTGGASMAALIGKGALAAAPAIAGAIGGGAMDPYDPANPVNQPGGASSTSSRLANVLGAAGTAASAYGKSAAEGRERSAVLGQSGVQSDAQAFRNMMRASMIADRKALSAEQAALNAKWGKSDLTPSEQQRQFAARLRDELRRRLLAGQPLTVSGAPKAGTGEKIASGISAAGTIAGILGQFGRK